MTAVYFIGLLFYTAFVNVHPPPPRSPHLFPAYIYSILYEFPLFDILLSVHKRKTERKKQEQKRRKEERQKKDREKEREEINRGGNCI